MDDVIGMGLFGLGATLMVVVTVTSYDMWATPDHLHRAVGANKTPWFFAVLLTGGIAGIFWWFKVRRKVLALVREPPRTPGFYPVPGTGTWRWWDGSRWVGPAQGPPPSSTPPPPT
jgi:hypothetical protein